MRSKQVKKQKIGIANLAKVHKHAKQCNKMFVSCEDGTYKTKTAPIVKNTCKEKVVPTV